MRGKIVEQSAVEKTACLLLAVRFEHERLGELRMVSKIDVLFAQQASDRIQLPLGSQREARDRQGGRLHRSDGLSADASTSSATGDVPVVEQSDLNFGCLGGDQIGQLFGPADVEQGQVRQPTVQSFVATVEKCEAEVIGHIGQRVGSFFLTLATESSGDDDPRDQRDDPATVHHQQDEDKRPPVNLFL